MVEHRLSLASAVRKAHPKLFQQVRNYIKRTKKEHLDKLERRWRWLTPSTRRVRRAEYITGYTLTEFRKRYPELVKQVQKKIS